MLGGAAKRGIKGLLARKVQMHRMGRYLPLPAPGAILKCDVLSNFLGHKLTECVILFADLMGVPKMTTDERPISDTEQKLVEIWQGALETSLIPVDAEFIDIGGDSLSAMMCISRVRSVFNCEIALVDFFMEGSTVANFAAAIDKSRAQCDG